MSNLQKDIERLSLKGCVKSMKQWWNSLSPKQKAIAIAILATATASPFIIAYAKKMTITTFIPASDGGLWIVEQAAPLWQKIFVGSMFASSVAGLSYMWTKGLAEGSKTR